MRDEIHTHSQCTYVRTFMLADGSVLQRNNVFCIAYTYQNSLLVNMKVVYFGFGMRCCCYEAITRRR